MHAKNITLLFEVLLPGAEGTGISSKRLHLPFGRLTRLVLYSLDGEEMHANVKVSPS